jgi:hypothetical protein
MSEATTSKELGRILADDAILTGSTAVIDAKMSAARTALKNNGATLSVLASSSMNGKTFTRSYEMTPARVLEACQYALRLVAGDGEDETEVASTLPDFRQLIR